MKSMPEEKKILRLNMQAFDESWMLNYATTHLRDNWSPVPWKNELMNFVSDWLSEADSIAAQTSGSTGVPKNVKLKKEYMKAGAEATLDFFKLNAADKVLLCLPIKYIAAKMMVVRAFVGKLDLYCIPPSLMPVSEWTPEIDFAAMTPAQLTNLLESIEGIDFLKRIKKLLLGGGPVPAILEEKTRALTTEIWHSYGMTETMSHIALRKVNGDGKSNYFDTLPGVQIAKSMDGCLSLTAPHLGLYGLQTNDMVTIEEDGRFQILGRTDHVVNSGGVKLFPEQIEQKISGFIREAFYVGSLPDNQLGEKLVLFVESELNSAKEEEKIKALLKEILTGFEVPKEIIFEKRFARTESGKIIREKYKS